MQQQRDTYRRHDDHVVIFEQYRYRHQQYGKYGEFDLVLLHIADHKVHAPYRERKPQQQTIGEGGHEHRLEADRQRDRRDIGDRSAVKKLFGDHHQSDIDAVERDHIRDLEEDIRAARAEYAV